MRRYIVLLLITGTVWAQTDFDKLISKAGTKYFGEYSKVEDKEVYFKPNNALEFQAVPLELIETLKLKNGTVLIQSGRINESALSLKKFSNEYEKLTIEETPNLEIENGIPIVYTFNNKYNLVKKDILVKNSGDFSNW